MISCGAIYVGRTPWLRHAAWHVRVQGQSVLRAEEVEASSCLRCGQASIPKLIFTLEDRALSLGGVQALTVLPHFVLE